MFCPQCGSKVEENSRFCQNCGAPLTQNSSRQIREFTQQYSAVPSERPHKKHTGLIVTVALLLVVALVVGIVASRVLSGPFPKLVSAVKKLEKAENATVCLSADLYGVPMEMEMQIDCDMDAHRLMAYGTMESDYSDIVLAIYEEYLITGIQFGSQTYYSCENIGEFLEEMFDAYEQGQDNADFSEVYDMLDEMMDGRLYELFDPEALEDCARDYAASFARTRWLEENVGYSSRTEEKTTYYEFQPNLYRFMTASVPMFEEAFLNAEDYEEAMESLDDCADELEQSVFSISFGVYSGYLSSVDLVMDIDGETSRLGVQIYDVGSTEIDESELRDILDRAMLYE